MSKFKVGDVVRTIVEVGDGLDGAPHFNAFNPLPAGTIGVIDEVVRHRPHRRDGEFYIRLFAYEGRVDVWGEEIEHVQV